MTRPISRHIMFFSMILAFFIPKMANSENLPDECGPELPFNMAKICKGESCDSITLEISDGCYYLKNISNKDIFLHLEISGEKREGLIPARKCISPLQNPLTLTSSCFNGKVSLNFDTEYAK